MDYLLPAPAAPIRRTHTWFLAEGATGAYFDAFVLIADPGGDEARCDVRFLLPDGSVVPRATVVPGRSRHTIWIDQEGCA